MNLGWVTHQLVAGYGVAATPTPGTTVIGDLVGEGHGGTAPGAWTAETGADQIGVNERAC